MSTPLLPLEVWTSQITQASVPANNNSLKVEVLNRPVQAIQNEQPTTPTQNDLYILGDAPMGAQWSLFTPYNLAIFKDGTWLEFDSYDGLVKYVENVGLFIYYANQFNAYAEGGAEVFTQLTDTPSSYVGSEGYKVVVKNDASGLEFVPDSGGVEIDWLNISSDLSPSPSIAGAEKSMAIGPNSETSTVITETKTANALVVYPVGQNGQVTLDDNPGFLVGEKIVVTGYPATTNQSYEVIFYVSDNEGMFLSGVSNFRAGQIATITNAPDPTKNGSWAILACDYEVLLLDGFTATEEQIAGATVTSTVITPNGTYTATETGPTSVVLRGWPKYSDETGLGVLTYTPVGQSIAIGPEAKNNADNGVALGYGTVNNAVNAVNVGGRRVVGLEPAIVGDDAVTLSQAQEMTEKSFIDLTDTPEFYFGEAGKMVVVKTDESGLEFIDAPAPTPETFTELNDTPSTYVGQAGKKVIVKTDESGLEFVPDSGGSDPWTYIKLTNDFLHSVTTFSTFMNFNAEANKTYIIEIFGAYRVTETTQSATLRIVGPTSSEYIGKTEQFSSQSTITGNIQSNVSPSNYIGNSGATNTNIPIENKTILKTTQAGIVNIDIRAKTTTVLTLVGGMFYLRYRTI